MSLEIPGYYGYQLIEIDKNIKRFNKAVEDKIIEEDINKNAESVINDSSE